jgi:hypothetical protein
MIDFETYARMTEDQELLNKACPDAIGTCVNCHANGVGRQLPLGFMCRECFTIGVDWIRAAARGDQAACDELNLTMYDRELMHLREGFYSQRPN